MPVHPQFAFKLSFIQPILALLMIPLLSLLLLVDVEFHHSSGAPTIYEATACFFLNGVWIWLPALRWPRSAGPVPASLLNKLFKS